MSEETTGTTESTESKVMGKINKIKTFVSEINVNELKANINTIAKNARADFNKLVNKDLESMKKKLQKEKADVEKKAKKFLEKHKKDINSLQARFEKLKTASSKLKKSAPAAKTTTKKVATKKATKKAPAKKATKKANP